MSISGSLANALSGLTAQSRAAELVSSNVANATTEGYARRDLLLTPRYMGGAPAGVGVVGVRRDVDMVTVQNRRLADAAVGHDTALSKFYDQLERVLGTPDEAGSLSGAMDRLETALIEAASRPDSEARLSAVLAAGKTIATHLNTSSDRVQELRMSADQELGLTVQNLNDGLVRVQELNYKIKEASARGQDASSLMDIRQQTIDDISGIVPMRQVERDHGTVALFTTGGAILLDGRAATVGYETVGVIVPEMTKASGALSGLTINGKDIDVAAPHSPIKGGSLQALFKVRDDLAVTAQTRLDAVARDVLERFADAGVDPTRTTGDPGLFTDDGDPFVTTDELGLSGRIAVNAAVDPSEGGALWRIRDGLGATAPGDVGNSALIRNLADAFTTGRVPASGDFLGASRSASGLAADLLSLTYAEHTQIEGSLSYKAAEADALKTQELANGVDTDQEMQKLMQIEQAYAANAKVIQTVSDLLDTLMRL
ncbi:flagellar hook-associated protein FlgK [Maritimibacter sp. UBA3975]|uniref:flagellar hook-associated protein FlgK n=1 Tax=Maritimibacter sp. UBA3975 TaxID=1946833 RepID=UPI000C0B1DE8|nr:flagellar hook-associated protein FlgK [Maritimibacter sp. UBA3975]MAM61868.1 flagellar hook-associated protein FlgK [Maritimibacter sp.]|tara:strand:+ start:14553 stop:16010 length:1458 start_codon:yes stop_codon:yes gene_type:complete